MTMKTPTTSRIGRGIAALGAGLALGTTVQAAPFLYAPGDLVLAFRQTGNASDYVVNIGKASSFSTLAPGTTVPITNLSASTLYAAFSSVNGLQWSIAAANRPPLVPGFPLQTLWVSAPRLDPNTPASPWLRKGQSAQGNAGSQIEGVGANAAQSSSLLPGGSDNTATGVVIPVGAPFPIGPVIGTDGNYQGAFQGRVENVTPDDFDGAPANVSRSDLYELLPGTIAGGTYDTPGRLLGYFELQPNGSLTFHAGAAPPPAPTISGIGRVNGVATVSFTTVASANYRLRAVSTLGAPVSAWPVVSGPIAGTGSILSLHETNAASSRFFAVEAQP